MPKAPKAMYSYHFDLGWGPLFMVGVGVVCHIVVSSEAILGLRRGESSASSFLSGADDETVGCREQWQHIVLVSFGYSVRRGTHDDRVSG